MYWITSRKDQILVEQTESTVQKNEMSGAWEAMQFINTGRAYPELDIPPAAYTDAYNFYRNNFSESNSESVASTWFSLGPDNVGGRTLGMAFHPNDTGTIWLGSASGGLWKSTTGGIGQNAWSYVPTGYPALGVSCIAIDPLNPSIMYIGTGETHSYGTSNNGLIERPTRGSVGIGILKSSDGGLTWAPSLDWQYQQIRGVWDIQMNPLNPNIIYAATTEGVYKTIDAGANWTRVLQELMVMDLLLDPVDTNYIYAGVGNVDSPNPGIYRSDNSGLNWVRLSNGLPGPTNTGRITLALNKQNKNSLIALVANLYNTEGIYTSHDKGTTWTLANGLTEIVSYQGWFAKGLCMKGDDSSRVLLGGVYLFRSEQQGAFPSLLPNTYDVHPDVHDIVSNPIAPEKIYILTDGGLYRSDDFGDTYYSCTDGYVTSQVYIGSVSHQDANIMLAGLQDNNTIKYTGSPYWEPVLGGDGSFNAIDPNNDMIMYASSQYLNIAKSTDLGFSFFDILNHSASSFGGNNVAFIAPFALSPSNTNVLYAGSDTLMRSDDGGFIWTFPQNALLDSGNVTISIGIAPSNSDSVYVCTAPSDNRPMHVFRSGDAGTNLIDISNGLPNRFPRDITVDPRDSRIVYIAFSGFGAGHLFKSIDAGSNWTDISTSLPDIPFHCITLHGQHPDTVFAGCDLGVFVSVDGGQSWDAFNTALPQGVMVFDLVYSPQDQSLIAFTHGNGVYNNYLNSLPVGINPSAIKKSFELKVLGNPANNTIQFRINKSGNSVISIFDVRGKKLLNKEIQATENEPEFLDIYSLSSGIYFLTAEINGERQTKKFVKK